MPKVPAKKHAKAKAAEKPKKIAAKAVVKAAIPAAKPAKTSKKADAVFFDVRKNEKPIVEVKEVQKSTKGELPKAQKELRQYFYAAGKRKTSIVRVRLFKKTSSAGNPVCEVNDRPLEKYFPTSLQQQVIFSPLKITGQLGNFDLSAKAHGGGPNSQAEAIRHGISRALLEFDPNLRLVLKRAGFLTRDSRIKERKKYGLHRARRGPQFSKR